MLVWGRRGNSEKNFQKTAQDPALNGADFSADPDNLQGYMTEQSAREWYGEMFDFYWEKICEAADVAVNTVMVYV